MSRLALPLIPIIPLLFAACVSADEAAPEAEADQASARELVTAPEGSNLPAVAREAVSYSWAVDPGADNLDLQEPAPFVRQSRAYWLQVSGEQLRAGVAVPTTAAGALIKINPAGEGAAQLNPEEIEVIAPDGRVHSGGAGMETLLNWDELRDSELPFAEGTSAFRLEQELGAGAFELRARQAADDAHYVVYVLDKGSTELLELSSDRGHYLRGDQLVVQAALKSGEDVRSASKLGGVLRSPAGTVTELTFAPGEEGAYTASTSLREMDTRPGELWTIEVHAEGAAGEQTVLRRGTTAFAYALPTARLTGAEETAVIDGALTASIGVKVASAGRYAVTGTLLGTNAEGELVPLMMSQSADYVEPGDQRLTLSFDPDIIEASQLHAPYEIRGLKLADQGRLGSLGQSAAGITVPTL